MQALAASLQVSFAMSGKETLQLDGQGGQENPPIKET